jgi:RNA polymerase sigma-70 factor, ECF subfamily
MEDSSWDEDGPMGESVTSTSAADYAREAVGHQPSLLSAAYRMTRNPADAEDLVQETLLKAHKNCSSYRGPHLRAWLASILKNTFINTYNARKLRQETVGLEGYDRPAEPTGIGRDPAEAVLDGLPDDALRAALSSLRPQYLHAVLLADVEGYAYKEIAKITDVPVGTVMSRLNRGRSALRKYLMEYAPEVPTITG